jgi:hypothetical protein
LEEEVLTTEAAAAEALMEEEIAIEVEAEEAPPEETLEEEELPAELGEAPMEEEPDVQVVAEEAAPDQMLEEDILAAQVAEPEALTEEEVTARVVKEATLDVDAVSAGVAEVETQIAEEMAPAGVVPAEVITAAPISDVERFKRHLERIPKDDETRLLLARAYCDQEQMKLALEQYAKLLPSKSHILSEAIHDVETIVASRPDNLEAHELLADLHAKNGQLQEAVDRYRWILHRLEAETE